MGRKMNQEALRHKVKRLDNKYLDETFDKLPSGVKNLIDRYLHDPMAPVVTNEDIRAFIKSQEGLAVIRSIICYGKSCTKKEQDRNQQKIQQMRTILGM